jgi:hypothetical protein
MAESSDGLFLPRAINVTLSGAGSAQVIVPVNAIRSLSLASLSTGTLTATVAIWASGDFVDPGNGDTVGLAAAEARANWNLLPPKLANPSGAGIDSRVVLSVCDAAVRVRVTWVSGSGTYLLNVHGSATPTPFTPLSLGSTLKLWLRGDLGITQSAGNVTAWADQSGNGNSVVNSGTIPFVASSINGQPGITCAVNAGMQSTTSSPLPAGSPRTIFFVAKASSAVGGGLFCNRLSSHTQEVWLMGASGSQPGLTYASDGVVVAAYYKIPTPTISNIPSILEVSVTGAAGATPVVYLNGASQVPTQSGPSTSVETGTLGFGIGMFPYQPTIFGFVGDICEAIICDTQLPAPDDASVKNYLSSRYRILVS